MKDPGLEIGSSSTSREVGPEFWLPMSSSDQLKTRDLTGGRTAESVRTDVRVQHAAACAWAEKRTHVGETRQGESKEDPS